MKNQTKNTPTNGYFQMNDMEDGMVDDVQDIDYVDYLLDRDNGYDGVDMDTEFEDLDGESEGSWTKTPDR